MTSSTEFNITFLVLKQWIRKENRFKKSEPRLAFQASGNPYFLF